MNKTISLDDLDIPKGMIDAQGVSIPDFNSIYASLRSSFQTIYGLSEDSLPMDEADNPDVVFLSLVSLSIYNAYTMALSVYNSFSPMTAQGNGLSQIVQINGISRKKATKSTVDLTLTGIAGVEIDHGKVKDTNNQTWDLPAKVTLDASGQAIVTATAEDMGAIYAPVGTVTSILTPTRGWKTVTNTTASAMGLSVETDAELRARQFMSTSLASQSIKNGVISALLAISGVSYVRVYENDTSVVDANGLPPHSVSAVVEGGDESVIAGVIQNKKSLGVSTFGTTDVTVSDEKGIQSVIHFFRPTEKPVFIAITLHAFQGYLNNIETQIKNNILGYFKALSIGEDVIVSTLYKPILSVENIPEYEVFDVRSVQVGFTSTSLDVNNLTVAMNERATISIDNITIQYE